MSISSGIEKAVDKLVDRIGKALPFAVQIILDKLCEYELQVSGIAYDRKIRLQRK